jgi:anti-sigma B factor antagonist
MIGSSLNLSKMSQKVEVYKPTGRLDIESYQEARNAAMAIANTRPDVFMIDLEKVDFIDSRGLGLLLTLLKFMRSIGSKLILCGMNKQVKILFSITSIENLFEIHDYCPIFATPHA